MTGTTIAGTYLVGITLSDPALQDPATITGTGSVNVTAISGSALHGTNAAAWSVYNSGTLIAPTRGVFLTAGGTITNFASGVINGGARGIDITGGSGAVTNAGSINGGSQQGIRLLSGGVVTNLSGGTITGGGTYAGVDLLQGGMVSNAIGGTILNGVEIKGAAGTLINSGVINHYSIAVYLSAGGVVTNGGTIMGYVEAASAASTITNSGTMRSVTLLAGGTVTNGGSIQGAVYVASAIGTVINTGSIVRGASGISLMVGGVVSNASTGIIDLEANTNIFLRGGTVVNAGQIGQPDYTGPVRFPGIGIYDNGAPVIIVNQAGGLIASSESAVNVINATAILINAGTITGYRGFKGSGSGGGIVDLAQGGEVTNLSSGVITVGINAGDVATINNAGSITGISLQSGTVVNTGTIQSAYVGTAVYSSGGLYNNDRLVLGPTAALGEVQTANTVSSVLELATGSSAGTLVGFGSTVRNFSTVVFDPGADWTIAGSPVGLDAILSGFTQGDTIDLVGLSETISTYAAGVLTLTGDQTVTLQLPGAFTPASFMTAPDVGTGTDVFLACYVRGTRIATPDGEVTVEALSEGDIVLLASGETALITWIGHRRLDFRRHPRPQLVWPVRVRSHAFARNLPRRDLLLSPDHAVFVDDELIPIRYLINATTIRQEQRRSVDYFHIQLRRHAILLANGLPAESYLDIGDRSSFENGGGSMHLHPDFASRLWEAEGCAPLCVTGAKLAAVRRRLGRIAQGAEAPRRRAAIR